MAEQDPFASDFTAEQSQELGIDPFVWDSEAKAIPEEGLVAVPPGAADELSLQDYEEQIGSKLPLGSEGEFGLKPLTERVLGMPVGRESFTAAGAMAGEAVGAGLARGKQAGMRGGGVAGAGVGSLLFDTVDGFVRWAQKDPFYEAVPSTTEEALKPTERAVLGEAKAEGYVQAIGPLLRVPPATIKLGFRKLFGTADPKTIELASLAEAYRVPFGIVQATGRGSIKAVTKVLGVIPFVGGPFKRSVEYVDVALNNRLYDMLDSFAPTVSTSATLSREMVDRASKKWDFFNYTSGKLYGKFFNQTKHLPEAQQAFIPTTRLREAAQKITQMAEAGRTSADEPQILKDTVLEWAQKAVDFPKRITPTQYQAKMLELRRILGASKEGVEEGVTMKTAMEGDLNSPALNFTGKFKNGAPSTDPDAITGPMIAKALKKANSYFNKGLVKFDSATGKKFGRVDKNVFKATWAKAGSKEKDELFSDLFNLRSVDSIQQLRRITGQKQIDKNFRQYIDNVLQNPKYLEGTGEILQPHKNVFSALREKLGIGTAGGDEVLEEVLRYSNYGVKDLKNFFRLVEAAASFKVPDPSTFLQRRVTLGGMGSLMAVEGAFRGSSGIPGIITKLAALRLGAKYLSNPKNLKNMTRGLDMSLSPEVRRNAYVRILKDVSKSPENSDLPLPTPEEIETTTKHILSTATDVGGEALDIGSDAVVDVIKGIRKGLNSKTMQKVMDAVSE